ncbi:hypothetical protein [Clostridium sp. YIM B02500]|uniref:hypothetical protein n=1 Tax=Clostridium sp. YIM B02500 TaxID=2910681 RepID=UPI001EEECCD5|nr:hypothetical protein [Clostridium sp. YIM B02500]
MIDIINIIKLGIPYMNLVIGCKTEISVSIFRPLSNNMFIVSLKESIKYNNKVPITFFIKGISIMNMTIIIVSIIQMSVCTPKYIGKHLIIKYDTANIKLESMYLNISIVFLENMCIPHIKINDSGISLRKKSTQVNLNITFLTFI